MPASPLSAFAYPFRGLRLILRPGFRRYAAFPLLINVALFAGLGSLLFGQLDGWVDALLPPGGWHDYVRWLVWPLAVAAFLLVGYFGFMLVGNVVAAPFNDLLAARVLATRGASGDRGGGGGLSLRGTLASFGDELRKLGFVAARALPALVLFVFPGVNVVAPAVWFVVASVLLAYEYLEFPFAKAGTRFADQRQVLRHDALATLGFGAGVSALMLIPGLNLAAIPASVAGACLLWTERWAPQAGRQQGNGG
jgi:CysZ protein